MWNRFPHLFRTIRSIYLQNIIFLLFHSSLWPLFDSPLRGHSLGATLTFRINGVTPFRSLSKSDDEGGATKEREGEEEDDKDQLPIHSPPLLLLIEGEVEEVVEMEESDIYRGSCVVIRWRQRKKATFHRSPVGGCTRRPFQVATTYSGR